MKPPQTLVIATHNRHKLVEIRRILGRIPFRAVGLDAFPSYTVRETGRTLEENALLKVRKGVRMTGHPCLSDDSGLEVKALGGAPGVFSARYAGPGCSYEDNNRKLLRVLKDLPPSRRSALFRCVVAYAAPDGRTRLFEGRVPGRIASEARGAGGFGYDPVFAPRGGGGRVFAEMTLEEKNAFSHRARAFGRAARFLASRAFDKRKRGR
jgi:XTP/dITP diphosphohydrolase